MSTKSEQIVFTKNGRLVQRVEILDREQITAQYILLLAEPGDTLRSITRKLPNWVKYKNNVSGILDKLIKLNIIHAVQNLKGAEIDEISSEAKDQAEKFIEELGESVKRLNFLGNNHCYYYQ